jgi:hypothetical protein
MALAAAASVWNNSTPAQQALWYDITTPDVGAYAYAIGQNLLNITWGLPPTKVPIGIIEAMDTDFINGGNYLGTTDGFLEFLIEFPLFFTGDLWAYMYIQTSDLMPSYGSGFASNTPGLPGRVPFWQPNGYVYMGKVGPFQSRGYYVVDWGDQYLKFLGYTPGPFPILIPGTNRYGRGQLQLTVYWATDTGITCEDASEFDLPNPVVVQGQWKNLPQSGIVVPQCPAGVTQPQYYPGTNKWPP